MPTISVYVRVEDVALFSALKDKSRHIHDMLRNLPPEAFKEASPAYQHTFNRFDHLGQQRQVRMAAGTVAQRGTDISYPNSPPGNNAPFAPPSPANQPPIAYNGPDKPELVVTPKGKSVLPPAINNVPESIRGAFVPANSVKPPAPKELQACCKGTEPCRHWVWDLTNGDGYVNTLTGEKKEVT